MDGEENGEGKEKRKTKWMTNSTGNRREKNKIKKTQIQSLSFVRRKRK